MEIIEKAEKERTLTYFSKVVILGNEKANKHTEIVAYGAEAPAHFEKTWLKYLQKIFWSCYGDK